MVDLEPEWSAKPKKSRRVGLDFEYSAYFATASADAAESK
jgi:hypothetical protein